MKELLFLNLLFDDMINDVRSSNFKYFVVKSLRIGKKRGKIIEKTR